MRTVSVDGMFRRLRRWQTSVSHTNKDKNQRAGGPRRIPTKGNAGLLYFNYLLCAANALSRLRVLPGAPEGTQSYQKPDFQKSDCFGERDVDFADFVGVFVDGNDFRNILRGRGPSKQRKWLLSAEIKPFSQLTDENFGTKCSPRACGPLILWAFRSA